MGKRGCARRLVVADKKQDQEPRRMWSGIPPELPQPPTTQPTHRNNKDARFGLLELLGRSAGLIFRSLLLQQVTELDRTRTSAIQIPENTEASAAG